MRRREPEDRTDVDVLCVPLVDGPGNDRRWVRQAVAFIDDVVSAEDSVLVHCHAGRSRSVAVVARFLSESQGITRQSALALIAAKRDIYLTEGIEEVLDN